MRRIVLISVLLLFVAITYAQKMQKVTATYTYYAPENVTLEEAKRTALDRAKLSAIADAYGTLVTQSNTMTCSREIEYNDTILSFLQMPLRRPIQTKVPKTFFRDNYLLKISRNGWLN